MLTAVYLPALLLSFCNGLLIPTLPLFASSFGVSLGLVGLVLAGEGLGTLLMDLPAGRLLRRFDHKPVMVVGVAVVALSVLALALARDVALVMALRLLAGAGAALWNLSRHAFLTEATRGGGRGRAISTFGGIARIGTFLGPAVGGAVAAWLGLRAPFVVFGVVGLASVVVVLRFVPGRLATAGRGVAAGGSAGEPTGATSAQPPTDASPARSSRRATGRAAADARRAVDGTPAPSAGFGSRFGIPTGVWLAAGSAQLMAQMLRAGRKVLLPLYASQVLGLDVGTVGVILSLSAFVDMTLFVPAGIVMDRLGRKFAIVPAFLFQALALALVPLTAGAAGLAVVGVLLGVGNGLSSGTMMTLGADLAPPHALGEFLGVWRLIGDGGSSGGPLVVGAVAEVLDLGLAAVVVAGVGLAAAAMFAFRVPETLRRSPARS